MRYTYEVNINQRLSKGILVYKASLNGTMYVHLTLSIYYYDHYHSLCYRIYGKYNI